MAAKVFISYSHKDEELRDQLEVQLAILKRQGLVETWHDRRMIAGDRLDWSIDKNLNEADIILLLLSPDFLNSDYCYKMEKAVALERAQAGNARLISVVLRPCDWKHTDLPFYVVTPKDAKPVTQWPDRDEAFLDVVNEIRRAIDSLPNKPVPLDKHNYIETQKPATDSVPPSPRSSNLRMTKTFTDADRDAFLHDGFEFIAKFFQGSLSELKARNSEITSQFRQLDANRFSVTVYLAGQKRSTCTVFLGGGSDRNSIAYSISENEGANSYNENVHVEHDQQSLYFKALGMSMRGDNKNQKLTHEGAAELFWAILIEPLQR
jgi:TIR domain